MSWVRAIDHQTLLCDISNSEPIVGPRGVDQVLRCPRTPAKASRWTLTLRRLPMPMCILVFPHTVINPVLFFHERMNEKISNSRIRMIVYFVNGFDPLPIKQWNTLFIPTNGSRSMLCSRYAPCFICPNSCGRLFGTAAAAAAAAATGGLLWSPFPWDAMFSCLIYFVLRIK